MRAFIVLLLALALAAGGYFAFQSSSKNTTDDTTIENIDDVNGTGYDETPGDDKPDTNLVMPNVDNDRENQPVDESTATGSGSIAVDENSDTGKVFGRIVNNEGKGIQDATVTLTRFGGASLFFSAPGEIDRSQDLKTRSNADGSFSFDEVPGYAMYTLLADHENYAQAEHSPVDTTQGAMIEQELILGNGSKMFGVIKDVQGNVVSNATVVLTPTALGAGPSDSAPGRRETTSGPTGEYEFMHCAKGPHVLNVSAEGYGQATIQNINVSGEADVERNVELDVAQLLAGRVIDQNGGPIAGAKVEAFLMANKNSRTQTSTLSDKDGQFEFSDVSGGSYTLRGSAKGYKKVTLHRINAGEMNVEIQLVPLPSISGQVFMADGSPATNYTINLRQGVRNSELSMLVSGSKIKVNDAEGRYTMTLPMAGDFMAEAYAGTFAPTLSEAFTAAEAQKLTGINITLSQGGTIRGRLVDPDGKPIKGVSIKTENNEWTGGGFDLSLGDAFPGMSTKKSAKTNAEGVFILRGLHPTKYLLMISHPQFAQTAVRNVVVSDGVETDLKDMKLEKGSSVTGTVRGPAGEALSGATVSMILETTTGFPLQYTKRTSPDGSFEIKGVRSGTYWVSATRPSSGQGGANPFAGAADMSKTRRSIAISGDGTYQGVNFEITD